MKMNEYLDSIMSQYLSEKSIILFGIISTILQRVFGIGLLFGPIFPEKGENVYERCGGKNEPESFNGSFREIKIENHEQNP